MTAAVTRSPHKEGIDKGLILTMVMGAGRESRNTGHESRITGLKYRHATLRTSRINSLASHVRPKCHVYFAMRSTHSHS